MDYKELKESYPNLPTAAKELEEEGHIFIIKNKDNTPRAIFFNDPKYTLPMSEGMSMVQA